MKGCCSCCCAGPKPNSQALALPYSSISPQLPAALISNLVFWYKCNEVPGSTILINYAPTGSALNATKSTDHNKGTIDFTSKSILISFTGGLSATIYPCFEINTTFAFPEVGWANKFSHFAVVDTIDGAMPAAVERTVWLGSSVANGFAAGQQRNPVDTFRSMITAFGASATLSARAHNLTTLVARSNFLNRVWLVNIQIEGVNAGDQQFRINRTNITEDLSPASVYGTAAGVRRVGRNVQGNPWEGNVYYLLGFNRNLTLAEQIVVEDFLVEEMRRRGVILTDGI